jgi:ATP-dependent helicase/nuclease subunit B
LLGEGPDARDRGNVLHKVMETFVPSVLAGTHELSADALCDVAAKVITATDYPPDVTAFWHAHVARIAPDVIANEAPRLALAAQILTELRGHRDTCAGFRLTCRADRFDIGHDSKLRIYDYKSTPPSKNQLKIFDFQLHLEAAIAEGGRLSDLGPQEVAALAYISLGTSGKDLHVAFAPSEAEEIWDQFCGLIGHWQRRAAGYTARRMMKSNSGTSDFDHLSRYGEWDITDNAAPEDVG